MIETSLKLHLNTLEDYIKLILVDYQTRVVLNHFVAGFIDDQEDGSQISIDFDFLKSIKAFLVL